MRGVYECNIGLTIDPKTKKQKLMTEEQLKVRNQKFMELGFIPDYEINCFVVEGFGAWMGDAFSPRDLKDDYFQTFFNMGYDMVIGPKGPNSTGNIGVFCKNYKELLEKHGNKFKR